MFDVDKHTYIFGILNVTPDSFSDGGKYVNVDDALCRAEKMISDGAAVIDIGGESTRPGYVEISVDEEISRVEPVIKAMRNNFDIPISIDTYKPEVARAALECGADIVNDIWGVRCDREMLRLVRDSGAMYVLMHNREEPFEYSGSLETGDKKNGDVPVDDGAACTNFLEVVLDELQGAYNEAVNYGIPRAKLVLDVGVGFGKTFEQNLWVLNNLKYFDSIGAPLFLGASRKSVIGNALGLQADERVEGTIATSILAAQAGYAFVRVHDVKENARAIRMYEAIRDSR